jgi:hypothetical protein
LFIVSVLVSNANRMAGSRFLPTPGCGRLNSIAVITPEILFG